jgi:hypothetical protein
VTFEVAVPILETSEVFTGEIRIAQIIAITPVSRVVEVNSRTGHIVVIWTTDGG